MPIPVAPAPVPTGFGRPGEQLQPPSLILGDIALGVTDEFGVQWTLGSIKGWFEPASSTNPIEPRAGDHGGWVGPAFYEPRIIEIEGGLEAASWDGAIAAFRRLTEAVSLDALETLYVSDGTEVLQAEVRQGGDILPTPGESPEVIEFSLSLEAPDPRRYSTDVATVQTGLPQTTGGLSLPLSLPLSIGATVSSGLLSAVNEGSMTTLPTMVLHGPVPPSIRITHRGTGRTLFLPDAIDAGRFVTLDFDLKEARLDGTSRVRAWGWFDYLPGVNEVSFSAATYDSGALLVSSHRSARR